MITLAKGIASGMPLGATVARAEIMDWKPGSHASTFGGNPVCVAASLATIELLERELIEMRAGSEPTSWSVCAIGPSRFPVVGHVRGLGLMIGFELVYDQQTKERAPELRDRIVFDGVLSEDF